MHKTHLVCCQIPMANSRNVEYHTELRGKKFRKHTLKDKSDTYISSTQTRLLFTYIQNKLLWNDESFLGLVTSFRIEIADR